MPLSDEDAIAVSRSALRAELSAVMRQPLHVSLTDALKQADEIIKRLASRPALSVEGKCAACLQKTVALDNKEASDAAE